MNSPFKKNKLKTVASMQLFSAVMINVAAIRTYAKKMFNLLKKYSGQHLDGWRLRQYLQLNTFASKCLLYNYAFFLFQQSATP